MTRVITRYAPAKVGFAACAVGPELRAAVSYLAGQAMAYAIGISPQHPSSYLKGFEVNVEVVPDIPFRKRGLPMARVAGAVVNKADSAIIVEVGGADIPSHRVLTNTLSWLELVADE